MIASRAIICRWTKSGKSSIPMFSKSRRRIPSYCYPRKLLHLNKMTFDTHWTLIWDKHGEYWKEQFGMFTPVKLADGREVWSVADVVIVNVQNGRSTIVTATRAYNQGYSASMFSLATLESIMRGGSIE